MPVITSIRANYAHFTKSERKIADYVINNVTDITYSTIRRISNAVNVGEATVLRFVEKCGYQSFNAFRYQLIKDIEHETSSNEPSDYADRLFVSLENEMRNTNLLLDRGILRQATQIIISSNILYFMGIGHSGVVAQLGAYRFNRLGKIAQSISDPHYQNLVATNCTENDCVIAISMSGNSPELLQAVKTVKANGSKIIAITSSNGSQLEKLSDITLYAAGRTAEGRFVRTGMESITTIINAMLLLDILEEAYIDTDPDVILDSSKHRTDKLQDTRKY